jgi:hypothetical protein
VTDPNVESGDTGVAGAQPDLLQKIRVASDLNYGRRGLFNSSFRVYQHLRSGSTVGTILDYVYLGCSHCRGLCGH